MIIKNGRIIDPSNGIDGVGNIYVKDGIIADIRFGNDSAEESATEETIDATGLAVMPGFIDVHSHFRDPGFEYKEDIISGAKAAAAGGYTSVVLMCNTKPVVDSVETLEYVLNKGKKASVKVESCSCVTIGLKGEKLTDFDEMIKHGAVRGFAVFISKEEIGYGFGSRNNISSVVAGIMPSAGHIDIIVGSVYFGIGIVTCAVSKRSCRVGGYLASAALEIEHSDSCLGDIVEDIVGNGKCI